MVNILLIQDTDWIVRGPHQQHHIFERLGSKGDTVHVIDFDILWNKKTSKNLFQKGFSIQPIPKTVKQSRVTVHRPPLVRIPLLDKLTIPLFHSIYINNTIRKHGIQIIVGQTILNSFCGLIFARIYGIPFIFHCIDSISSISEDYIPKPFHFVAKLLEMAICKYSDMNIAINKALRNYLITRGAKPEKTIFLPTGVDFQKFQDASNRLKTREELGISNSDLVLFFMGWLYTFSGLKELADYLVDNSIPDLKLLIVGDGDLYPYLSKLASTTTKIVTTGRISFDNIPALLSAADICVLPSQSNQITAHIVPIKLYEYMAAGKPVIASNLPGLMQEFGKTNGILYCSDIEELVKIANQLRENHEIEAVGEKGRQCMASNDWSLISIKYRTVLLQLLKSKRYNKDEN